MKYQKFILKIAQGNTNKVIQTLEIEYQYDVLWINMPHIIVFGISIGDIYRIVEKIENIPGVEEVEFVHVEGDIIRASGLTTRDEFTLLEDETVFIVDALAGHSVIYHQKDGNGGTEGLFTDEFVIKLRT